MSANPQKNKTKENKKVYNKLVRDKIPEIIHAKGERTTIRILNKQEYFQELINKLKEEVSEFEQDPSVEELADIKEVLIALRIAMGIHAGILEDTRRQKANERGRFAKRIYLESVE